MRGLDYYTRTVFELMPSDEEDEEVIEEVPVVEEKKDNRRRKRDEEEEEETEEEREIRTLPVHALGGGGRYDNLVEQLGGRPTPACGFGIGIERAILQMKSKKIPAGDHGNVDVFLAQLGDAARRKAFVLFEEMRGEKMRVSANFSKGSLKSQLEIANRLNAKFTAIIGQQEVLDGTTLVRDMESGMQEIVAFDKTISALKKKLS